jgi:hypothetical protein
MGHFQKCIGSATDGSIISFQAIGVFAHLDSTIVLGGNISALATYPAVGAWPPRPKLWLLILLAKNIFALPEMSKHYYEGTRACMIS